MKISSLIIQFEGRLVALTVLCHRPLFMSNNLPFVINCSRLHIVTRLCRCPLKLAIVSIDEEFYGRCSFVYDLVGSAEASVKII